MLKKINTCWNNHKNSYTEKKAKHTPSGYVIVTSCSFNKSKNDVSYYRGEDCIQIFCKNLREEALKIINYEKRKKEY